MLGISHGEALRLVIKFHTRYLARGRYLLAPPAYRPYCHYRFSLHIKYVDSYPGCLCLDFMDVKCGLTSVKLG